MLSIVKHEQKQFRSKVDFEMPCYPASDQKGLQSKKDTGVFTCRRLVSTTTHHRLHFLVTRLSPTITKTCLPCLSLTHLIPLDQRTDGWRGRREGVKRSGARRRYKQVEVRWGWGGRYRQQKQKEWDSKQPPLPPSPPPPPPGSSPLSPALPPNRGGPTVHD